MVKPGDLVLLYKEPQRKYLLKIENKKFHTDCGVIDLKEALGKEWGSFLKTSLGKKFYILKPTLQDLIMKVNRLTQIIYPKDAGLILLNSGITPHSRVIECGSGSGAFTSVLANFIRPPGKIYSYEKRKEFLENTRKNLEKYGFLKWVELKNKEITEEFEEKDVDFVMIDIGSPWELIEAGYKALRPSGRMATICPTFEQLTHSVFSLQEKGFVNIETLEVLTRKILVRRGKTRPEQKIPSHTGYLVMATKIIR